MMSRSGYGDDGDDGRIGLWRGAVYSAIRGKRGQTLLRELRDAMDELIAPGGIVLSFGWNSGGMGLKRGYEIAEILLVAHGGAHNDTICVAERKTPDLLTPPARGER